MPSSYLDSLKRLLTCESTPKLGLARIQALLHELGNPERRFESIHIAGTNGKGSTSAFTASLLQQAKNRVGLYTSPHLTCARERIQINRELISEDLFCEATNEVFAAADRAREKPTFFELMTAMAFWIFAERKVDVAVIEVGLGGRLDSTNVIMPSACTITRLDLDHCDFLGPTLEEIAREKAGIIKPGTPIITGWQEQSALTVIRAHASQMNATFIEITEPCAHNLSLLGEHQKQNAALAERAVEASGVKLTNTQIETAFKNTRWPARLEFISEDPAILVDGAHNPAGMRSLVNFLQTRTEPLLLVLGTTRGHNHDAMIREFLPLRSRIECIIATESRSPRAQSSEALATVIRENFDCEKVQGVQRALEHAVSRAGRRGALTIVTGSLYVAGEARSLFFKIPIDPELPHY